MVGVPFLFYLFSSTSTRIRGIIIIIIMRIAYMGCHEIEFTNISNRTQECFVHIGRIFIYLWPQKHTYTELRGIHASEEFLSISSFLFCSTKFISNEELLVQRSTSLAIFRQVINGILSRLYCSLPLSYCSSNVTMT